MIIDVFPSLTAEVIAVMGGMILGYAMFRYLPGMKKNTYPASEWLPVGIVIMVIAWVTFIAPQFLFLALTYDQEVVWGHLLFESVMFYSYALVTITTLYLLQRRRTRKE